MSECVSVVVRRGAIAAGLAMWLCGVAVAGLAGRIDKIIEPKKGGDHSILVVAPQSGTVVYSYNARTALIPASNMKLITTAAALTYLRAGFEYKTRVGLWGDTLVVIGSGDPLLGDQVTGDQYGRDDGWMFEKIVQALQERGVEEVNDIIIDTTVFDNQRVHPSWPAKDYNKWYACEVCGLNYRANCIDVTASNIGGAVAVTVEPQTSFVEIINDVKPITSGEGAVGAYRTQTPNKITVFGRCKNRQGPFRVAIEQPAAFFGFVLAEHLMRSGISARGQLIERVFDEDDGFRPLTEFGTPIADVLRRANTDSLGLAAEALLKAIDAHGKPDRNNGSWAGGRERIAAYLTGLGISAEQFYIDDGSGLSRQNRLSAHAIATVLLALYASDDWNLFQASLAVGGEAGTIDRYFSEPRYRGNIRGKTGYIAGVRSFSGICQTAEGPYIFSILSNGAKGLSRDEINGIAKAIIDEYGDSE